MKQLPTLSLILGVGVGLTILFSQPAWSEPEKILERGKWAFWAAGGCSCHTDSENAGEALAGGRALKTPFGVFYSTNITPDKKYGIGGWSDEEFFAAMTEGLGPNGQHYYPSFPYTSFTKMDKADLIAMKRYLDQVPAIERENTPHELPFYARWRWPIKIWKFLFLDQTPWQANSERTAKWNRGSYLVEALGHCRECHTPRNIFGGYDREAAMIGTDKGPEGRKIPGISTRFGQLDGWSETDLAYYLKSGMDPNGDFAGGVMAELIDNGFTLIPEEDLQAIAHYILNP